jgi:hypothetical protein
MNGQYQETLGDRIRIPEEHTRQLIRLLTQMIHQRLTASSRDNMERASKKGLEHGRHLRDTPMP